tara:strand:+ start:1392 stop:1577 length:186 start_codon:yes stop_codon:yes gene_type:complete
MTMKFRMAWRKSYYEYGTIICEADSEREAELKGLEEMKGLDSATHYYPEDDAVFDIEEATQ